MIWILLILFGLFALTASTDEEMAMGYVGADELKKAKANMSEKEYKAYVKEKAKQSRGWMAKCAKEWRNK